MASRTKAGLMLPPLSVSRLGPTRPTALEPASVWQVAQLRANSSRPLVAAALRSAPPAPREAWSAPLLASTSAGRPMPITRMTSAMPRPHRRRDARDSGRDPPGARPLRIAASTTDRPRARKMRTKTRVPITSGTLPGDPAPSASPNRQDGPGRSSPPPRGEALHRRRDGAEVPRARGGDVLAGLLGSAPGVLAGE